MEERAKRIMVDIRIDFRRRGSQRSRADLLNISTTGCLIETSAKLQPDEEIWIYLDDLQPLTAKVVRVDGFSVACNFKDPIAEPVYEHWLAKMPK